MAEVPHLRWFQKTDRECAMCGGRATGILRGNANESYGHYCEPCAMKRLKAAREYRKTMTSVEKVVR